MALGSANIRITTNATQAQAELTGLQRSLNSLRSTGGAKTSLIPGLTQTTTQVNGLSSALKNMAGSFAGASMGAGGITQTFNSATQSSNALTNSLLTVMMGGKTMPIIFKGITTSVKGVGNAFQAASIGISAGMSGISAYSGKLDSLKTFINNIFNSLTSLGHRRISLNDMIPSARFANACQNLKLGLAFAWSGVKDLGTAFMGMASIATVAISTIGLAIAALIAVGFTALLAKIIVVGIKYNAMMEQMKVGYGVMLQGFGHALDYGEKSADRLMGKLKEFANVTPFTMPQVAKGADSLLGYGIGEGKDNQVEQITAAVRMLGDVSKGVPEKLNLIAYAYGQIYSMGRLQGQELRQLINAGWNPLLEIARRTGKTMGELKQEMQDGKISIDMITQALIDATSEGGRFYDMMKKQSETFAGRWSTLVDKVGIFAGKATEGLFNSLKGSLNNIINLFDELSNNINMVQLGAAFDVNILPVLKEIGNTMLWIIGLRDNMFNVTKDGAAPAASMKPEELKNARIDYNSGKSKINPDLPSKNSFVDMGNSIDNVTQNIGGLLKSILAIGIGFYKIWQVFKIFILAILNGISVISYGSVALIGIIFNIVTVIVGAVGRIVLIIAGLIEGIGFGFIELVKLTIDVGYNIGAGIYNGITGFIPGMLNAYIDGFISPLIAATNVLLGGIPGMALISAAHFAVGMLPGKMEMRDMSISGITDAFSADNASFGAAEDWINGTADILDNGNALLVDMMNGMGDSIMSISGAMGDAWNDLMTPIDTSSIDAMLAGFASKNKKSMEKLTDAERNALLGAPNSAKDGSGSGKGSAAKGAADEASKALEQASGDAKGLAESIMSVTDELVNMGNAFEKVTYEKFSPYKLMVRMNRFLSEMKNWTKNMSTLTNKGVPAGMVNELSKMGMQGYGMVKALSHASDAQREKIINQYQEARSIGWNVAEAQTKWEQTNIIQITGNSIVSPQLVDVLTDKIVQKIRLNTGT